MKNFDETQSYQEGWVVSQCEGSLFIPNGWYEIQKLDENTSFNTDLEAKAFVHQRAIEGSTYHHDALFMMDDENFRMVRELQESAQ